ncbi:Zinc finger BED domain containing protein [Gracilaria domingensis]|nr:Zinc finger BED domain containing protein [Gracilaria domingensis]
MTSLGFVKNCSKRNLYKGKGSILIRRLLKNYENNDKRAEVCVVNEAIAGNDSGKDKFSLSEMFDVAESGVGDEDSFEKYMGRKFSAPALHKMRAIKKESDHGDNLIKFWISQEGVYPDLKKVALRIYATPVSSCSSERNFSAVNRIITADRSGLKSSLVEDILFLRTMEQ